MIESAFLESIYDDSDVGDGDEDDDGAESSVGGRSRNRNRRSVITTALQSVATPRQHKGLPKRVVYPLMILALSWAGFALVRQRDFKESTLLR